MPAKITETFLQSLLPEHLTKCFAGTCYINTLGGRKAKFNWHVNGEMRIFSVDKQHT